jgi:hypothetical protein
MRQDVGDLLVPGRLCDRSTGAAPERIIYANEETGHTIARVATDCSATDLRTAVGSLLGAQPGP